MNQIQLDSYLELFKNQSINILSKVLLAFLVFFAGWVIIRYLKELIMQIIKRGHWDKALTKLISSVLSFTGWIITIAAIFKVLGFTEVSLAFSGSLALVAMGLANSASSIVGDLFSGVSLIADDDFEIGAKVTAAGITGIVEGVDMRKTRIRDDKGNLYILPNKSVDNAIITITAPVKSEPENITKSIS